MASILCVVDEAQMRQWLDGLLTAAGYDALFASSQDPILAIIAERPALLALIDTLDTREDELRVCAMLRQSSEIPILLLTDQNCQDAFLSNLEAGASDCVVKPVRAQELLARIEAAVRRNTGLLHVEPRQTLRYADLAVEVRNRRVLRNNIELLVGPISFRLLVYFMEHAGRLITRQELLRRVWGYPDTLGDTNLVDTAIRRLREDLDDRPKESKYIFTVWGIGYRFGCDNSAVETQK
jgi:DNA-binding response OmpR family regulator